VLVVSLWQLMENLVRFTLGREFLSSINLKACLELVTYPFTCNFFPYCIKEKLHNEVHQNLQQKVALSRLYVRDIHCFVCYWGLESLQQ